MHTNKPRTIVSNVNFKKARQAGIEHWRDVTPKSLRKAYETVLRSNKLDVKDQEFLMGHILPGTQDPYYDSTKTEYLREKYRKIEFFPRKSSSTEELRKKQVLDMVKVLGFSDDKIKRVEEALAKYEKADEAMEEIRKLGLDSSGGNKASNVNHSRNGNGHNQRNSYIIVKGEHKLVNSLNNGWDLVKELPEDKFILKKDYQEV